MTATQTKCSRAAHSCPKPKKPAKNYIGKLVKLSVSTYVCNDLTYFEYEAHSKAENRKLKKTREITSTELIFGGFQPFETTVRRAAAMWRNC